MLANKRLFLLVFIGLFFSGCATVPYKPAIMPQPGIYHIVGSGQTLYRISKTYGVGIKEIMRANNIKNPHQIGVGEKLFIPKAQGEPLYIESSPVSAGLAAVEDIVGEKQYRVKWKTITLHHSGTKEGNAGAFDRNHRKRGMGGLFYHFVIGNGTGSGDGEIEVGWRWRRQVEVNRHNDIQICLVGDFNCQEVSPAQLKSLTQLIAILRAQYDIPLSSIRTHKFIPGKITECPGKHFPFSSIISKLSKA